jgi:hypothetical protein
MRNTLRDRNRWFTAVAMTCLSGFALCGCTSSSRDVSSHLPDSAGRDAIDAERRVAERKRQETGVLKLQDRTATANHERALSPQSTSSRQPGGESEAVAHAKTGQSRNSRDTYDLKNADWAGESLDRRVKPASDENEGVVDTAEPRSDSPRRGQVATDLFDNEEDEASVRVQKPARPSGSAARPTPSENPKSRPGRASYDDTDDLDDVSVHPWAGQAPTTARSSEPSRPAAKVPQSNPGTSPKSADLSARVTAVPKTAKTRTPAAGQSQPDDARQVEARARVGTLLTQAKSLVNKGEFRSAYRVSQLAQRIADSEDLFFVAGEEQPADIVRSILMKVRTEEIQQASTSHASPDDSHPAFGQTEAEIRSRSNRVTRAEGWSDDAWQNHQGLPSDEPNETVSLDHPWQESATETTSKPLMRINPGPSTRRARLNPEFPGSRPQWRNSQTEPLALSRSAEVVPDQMPTVGSTGFQSETEPAARTTAPVRGELPSKSRTPAGTKISEDNPEGVPEPLAIAQNWRDQSLNNVATDRMPLLVAPLPPREPLIPDVLGTEVDDTFATDIREPTPVQPESRLWMILAAAAGAFAMLFVRRRPAPVVRPVSDGN